MCRGDHTEFVGYYFGGEFAAGGFVFVVVLDLGVAGNFAESSGLALHCHSVGHVYCDRSTMAVIVGSRFQRISTRWRALQESLETNS